FQSLLERCAFYANSAISFSNSGVGGAVAAGNDLSVRDCVFIANLAAGVHFNGAGAISAVGGSSIDHCTFVLTPTATACLGLGDDAFVTASIFAFNRGDIGSASGFTCCDFFRNDESNGPYNTYLCLFVDPEFCATDPAASRNVGLQADSPCGLGNHPELPQCGLIGAAPVACGSVSTASRSWSRVKSMYR